MFKILILFPLLFIFCFKSNAQVVKYRCYQYDMIYADTIFNRPKSDTSNMLIVVDEKKSKIHSYGQKESDFDLIQYDSSTKNQIFETALFRAVDQDGVECQVGLVTTLGEVSPLANLYMIVYIYPTWRLKLFVKKE
jgi:hypothetical protein